MLEIEKINNIVNSFVWGPYMLVLLVGTGIYMSIRTRLFQITKINLWMKSTYGSLHAKDQNIDHNVTPFQAVSTALASTIGIGSIAGIATAIVAGGPGALFWMLVSAFFGMITKFSEVVLLLLTAFEFVFILLYTICSNGNLMTPWSIKSNSDF